MLHRVREYGLKGGESEPGFKPQQIRWALSFSGNGEYLSVMKLGDVADNRGRRFDKCPKLEGSGNVIWTDLAWGPLSKVLGWTPKTAGRATKKKSNDEEKNRLRSEFFIARLEELSDVDPRIGSCARSLKDQSVVERIEQDLKRRGAKPEHNATVEIDGSFPIETPGIQRWWRDNWKRVKTSVWRTQDPESSRAGRMRCLLTGELTAPARVHPFIQGMSDVGGNAKSALVSFNKAAFCSFGQKQSDNAAVSEQAATEYAAALNQLIANRSRRLISYRYIQQVRKGKSKGGAKGPAQPVWTAERAKAGQDAKVILWFDKPEINDALDSDILFDPSPFEGAERREAAQAEQRGLALLSAIQRGERPDLGGTSFFSAVLSSATSRVMVRSWQEGPLTQFADAVIQWFLDLEIVDPQTGEKSRHPPFARLVGALARKKSDVAPSLVQSLWLAATQQREIPAAIVVQVLNRLRVEVVGGDNPRHEAAALLKAWLLRGARRKGEQMTTSIEPALREDHPDPAYQCGRLMALLADIQRRALPSVSAGVIQRYFTSASAAPCLVFGRLLRNSQHHLEKLDPGLRYVLEGKMASVAARIGERYPASLGLEGQSMFALGYYQQIAEDRRMRQINKVKKEMQANG